MLLVVDLLPLTYYVRCMATDRPPTTGDNIAAEMKRHRVSQATLAEHLGLSQAAVSARIRGVVDWRLAEIIATAELFDMQINDLLADADKAGAA